MAIDPNTGAEFKPGEFRIDDAPKGNTAVMIDEKGVVVDRPNEEGIPRPEEPVPSKEAKRATVNIHSRLDRPIMLHLHQTIADDGSGRPFQGRLLSSQSDKMPDLVQLRAGHNAGIDKEFWMKWCEQNKGSDLLSLITAEDETQSQG